MDGTQYLKFLVAFVFVLALMGGLAWLMRRLGLAELQPRESKTLKVVEHLPIDGRHRLVLVQRGPVQHLLSIGPEGQTVIETGIKPKQNKASKQPEKKTAS